MYVVDSRNLSTGHGLVVLEAALAAQRGEQPEACLLYTSQGRQTAHARRVD